MNIEMMSQILKAAAITTPTLLIAAIYIKFRRRKLKTLNSEPMIDDPEALALAQAVANSMNVRKELAQSHVLLDNYSTMQGYTMNYMDQLVSYLSEQDIEAHYYFQEAMPTGMITVTGATGTYELYIPRGSEAPAREAISRFRHL